MTKKAESPQEGANETEQLERQGTRKQKPRLFFETEKQRFLFVFVEAAEGKQEGLWEGSGHSGQWAGTQGLATSDQYRHNRDFMQNLQRKLAWGI